MIPKNYLIPSDCYWLADGVTDGETGTLLPYTHALYITSYGERAMICLADEEARAIQIELAMAAHEGRQSIVIIHPPGGSERLFLGTIIEFQRITDAQADEQREKAASAEAEEEAIMRRAALLGQRPGRRSR